MSWVAVGWDANGVKYWFKSDGSQFPRMDEATFFDDEGEALMLANEMREESWGKVNYPGEGPPPEPPKVVNTAHEAAERPDG